MTITNQRVTCLTCKKVSDVEMVTQAPLAVWTASAKAARCPHCGSPKLGLGGAHGDAPPLDTSIGTRANWWVNRGAIGTSSLTIWAVFTGLSNPHGRSAYPLDPDDFSRCRKLLDLIPEWRNDLALVAAKHPWFQPFADRWDEFDRLYDAELPTPCSAASSSGAA